MYLSVSGSKCSEKFAYHFKDHLILEGLVVGIGLNLTMPILIPILSRELSASR